MTDDSLDRNPQPWPDPPSGIPLGDGREASAIERPESIADLRAAVRRRVAEGLAIYPQGGGTALDYGGSPRRPGVAFDTRSLNRVIDYPAADMTITIESGMTLAALQATLAGSGQRLPLDAPDPDRATLGAVFATNTSGPRRFGAGRPRDMILGVHFVNAEGQEIKGGGRVVKNVAGYDFPRLLTGSMGTLGIITRLTIKVRPIPESSSLVIAPFDRLDGLADALTRLNTSDTRPIAVEVLNRSAARLVHHDLPDSDWLLAVGFEDNAASVAWQTDRLATELDRPGLRVLDGDDAAPLWRGLIQFPALEPGPLVLAATLAPSAAIEFLNSFDPDSWAVSSHAGNGIVRAQSLGNRTLQDLAETIDDRRALAVRVGGNPTLPRCPTAWKDRLGVWGMPRADWTIMERIKRAFDPGEVMNPGRFVGTI